MIRSVIETFKVLSPEERATALSVVDQVFRQEKRWVAATDTEIPATPDPEGPMSWFAATVDGRYGNPQRHALVLQILIPHQPEDVGSGQG